MGHTKLSLLLAGVSALALPNLASAQTAGAQTPDAGATSEIVVTGSRIITNGNNMPTPVTVVTVAAMQNIQPSTIAENLNYLPEFSQSHGTTSRDIDGQAPGGQGAATRLNLRGLGTNRNLLLMDGHRIPPTLLDGTVDADMIPQMMIQRVDVVTGGVSAVYGSDAISGVINFIVDHKLEGLKLNVQGGLSSHSDDPQQDLGIAYGRSFLGGRLHLEGSFEFRNDLGIPHKSDRSWQVPVWAIVGTGTAQFPYYISPYVRLNTATFGGLITNGALKGETFDSNGVLTPFVHGVNTGSPTAEVGGDGYYEDPALKAAVEGKQEFLRGDYELTDDIHAFAEFSGEQKIAHQIQNPLSVMNVTMSAANGYLPATYQAQMAAAKQTSFTFSEFALKDAPAKDSEGRLDSYQVDGGFQGKLFGKFNWELYGNHGWTTSDSITHGNVNNQLLDASLDAVVNPANGQVVCQASLANSAYSNCVPINMFGPTTINPAAISYFSATTSDIVQSSQDDIEASISGPVYNLPAGPLSLALSADWRHLEMSETNTANAASLANCAGIRFNCTATTSLYQSSGLPMSAHGESVEEGALESEIPVLKELPFARSLSLNGAVRYTNYSISGSNWSWKVGGDWKVNDLIAFRAAQSQDIRAPALYDLYQPLTITQTTIQDLLTLNNVTIPQIAGGNPNLKAEIGHTTTWGIVFTPLPGLSFSVDRYLIHVTNALNNERGNVQAYQQQCYASGGTSPACALQTRPLGFTNTTAANNMTSVSDLNVNVASMDVDGYDFEMNYATRLYDRPFNTRILINNQPINNLIDPSTGVNIIHAGVTYDTQNREASPVWQVSAIFHYQATDALGLDLSEHWRSQLTNKAAATQFWISPTVPTFYTTNVGVTYTLHRLGGQEQAYVNVQNLFAMHPPPAAYYNSPSPGEYGWPVGDDPVGRYFTVGVRAKF